jgi:hypothetical protein
VYILHLPLVAIGQALVVHLELPALAKFALVVAGVFGVSFGTYQLMVRYSFVGAMLNGRKYRAVVLPLPPVPAAE